MRPNDTHTPPSEDLAHKVLERIDEQHVEPRPRWQFLLKNQVQWLLLAMCLAVGAITASAAIYGVANAGWEFREVTNDSLGSFLFQSIPFLWIAALAIVLILAYENFRHTKSGYRYPVLSVIGLVFLIALIGGAIFFATGFGHRFEEGIGGRIPFHRPPLEMQNLLWMKPGKGLLVGEVVSIDPVDKTCILKALDGKEWNVDIQDINALSFEVLQTSRLVRVVGIAGEDGVFRSCLILPWEIHGMPSDMHPIRIRAAAFTSQGDVIFERNEITERTTDCEGVRPYIILKKRYSGE
ncbi:MAG: hypothetical protein WC787_04640 [Patescibacteria group bacterium]|jgi:hypothetical protein